MREGIYIIDIFPHTRLLKNLKFYPYRPLKPRGDYSVDTKDINFGILYFKQFYKHFVFDKDEEGYVKILEKLHGCKSGFEAGMRKHKK